MHIFRITSAGQIITPITLPAPDSLLTALTLRYTNERAGKKGENRSAIPSPFFYRDSETRQVTVVIGINEHGLTPGTGPRTSPLFSARMCGSF